MQYPTALWTKIFDHFCTSLPYVLSSSVVRTYVFRVYFACHCSHTIISLLLGKFLNFIIYIYVRSSYFTGTV